MPRALQWFWGGGAVSHERGTPVLDHTVGAREQIRLAHVQGYLAHKKTPTPLGLP